MNYNDAFVKQLKDKGYTGSVSDAFNKYLQDNTDIVSQSTDDLMYAWLGNLGFTGSINDRMFQYATSVGMSGHSEQVINEEFLTEDEEPEEPDQTLVMNGTNHRGVFLTRAIDPDGDIDISFRAPSSITVRQSILSQQVNLSGFSEFLLESSVTSVLQMTVGGAAANVLTVAQGYEADKRYRVKLVGTSLTVWKDLISDSDTPVRTTSFTRGAVREPSAVTTLGAAVFNTPGSFIRFFAGPQSNIRINNITWSLGAAGSAVQLPSVGLNTITLFNTSILDWI